MPTEYLPRLQAVLSTLIDHLSAMPPEKLNIKPGGSNWSRAQVADHVLKSIEGVPALLQSKTMETQRDPW